MNGPDVAFPVSGSNLHDLGFLQILLLQIVLFRTRHFHCSRSMHVEEFINDKAGKFSISFNLCLQHTSVE